MPQRRLTDADITSSRSTICYTFASRLVQAGVDLNTVRELMTHSDIKIDLIYAHLTDENKSDAVDRAFAKAAA
ncbi:MAG: tyrosine-type recombinase/integrase [Gammaproteobacteria bacterium]|nr:tyrosine-type recombinase/integrase [Gammaproteobacteria bacterium]